MATVVRSNFGSNWKIADFNAFINNMNCPLVTVTSSTTSLLTLNVNNEIDVKFNYSSTRTQVTYNGTTTDYSLINTANSMSATLVYSDKVFYIHFNCAYNTGRRFEFVYELIGNDGYYGAVGAGTASGSGHAWYPISDISLINTTSSLSYIHGKRLNYSTQMNHIDYTTDILFSAGYLTDVVDPNFITCSAVAQDQVVTFNAKNYYSIGPNTLIAMD